MYDVDSCEPNRQASVHLIFLYLVSYLMLVPLIQYHLSRLYRATLLILAKVPYLVSTYSYISSYGHLLSRPSPNTRANSSLDSSTVSWPDGTPQNWDSPTSLTNIPVYRPFSRCHSTNLSALHQTNTHCFLRSRSACPPFIVIPPDPI